MQQGSDSIALCQYAQTLTTAPHHRRSRGRQPVPIGTVASRHLLGARSPRAARSRTASGSGSPEVVPHCASLMHCAPSSSRDPTEPMGARCQPLHRPSDRCLRQHQSPRRSHGRQPVPIGTVASRHLLGARSPRAERSRTTSSSGSPAVVPHPASSMHCAPSSCRDPTEPTGPRFQR